MHHLSERLSFWRAQSTTVVTAAGTQSVVCNVADCSHFEEHFAIGGSPIVSLFVPNDLE